jgi:hypothetical protein
MAYTTIDDPSAYFHTQLYTGNGSTQSITNNANAGDFQPDWVWIKNRGQSDQQHNLYDSTRGSTKRLESSNNGAESTKSNGLTSFDSDGFSVGSADQCNENSENLVAWQWKANGGTTTTNDASATGVGDIDSVYQANTTAGFSIVTYTHTGNDDRVAHGLGATPKVVIIKERGGAGSWYYVTTQVDGSLEYLLLESQNAIASLGYSVHTSTTFPSLQFDNTDTAVAYCFTEIQGYSKFGSYTGNGDADGPFIYTGFKPAWFLVKSTSQSNQQWYVFDNKRDTINPVTRQLQPNLTDAENNVTNSPLDFLSNGIKIRNTSGHDNTNSGGYIYMAFAEHPFVSSEGVPVTAR